MCLGKGGKVNGAELTLGLNDLRDRFQAESFDGREDLQL